MIALLVALALLVPGLAQAGVQDLPCVLCHPSRDRQTFDLLSQIPDVSVGSESAQAFVCLSCHNGSVVDSRERLSRGGQHPSGVGVKRGLPKEFPLYGQGRMTCGTCHSPHGEGPGAERWLRVRPDGVATCAGCHQDHRNRHLGRSLSGTMADRIQAAGGRPGATGEITCLTCHAAHGAAGDQLLVAAYGGNRDDLCRTCHGGLSVKGVLPGGRSQACSACHSPHGEGGLLLTGGDRGPCVPCHSDHRGPGDHRANHPACAECHSIHSPVKMGGEATGLLRMPNAGGLLCTPCHGGLGTRHRPTAPLGDVNLPLLRARGLALGSGVQLECTSCHKVHGAGGSPLLPLEQGVLCLYCHRDANPYGAQGIKPGPHPVGVLLRADQRQALGGEGSASPPTSLTCVSCHRAHLSAEKVESVACLTCHPQRRGAAGHGGVEGCGACHGIHAQTPPSRTCTGCHPDSLAGPHAQGQALSPGPLPAFDREGRRAPAGAMACPTCHDPHATAEPRLRRASAAETCLACHGDKKGIQGGAHDPAAAGGDRGLCLSCHPAHGPGLAADAEDPVGARCRSCHPGETVLADHSPEGTPAWKGLKGSLPLFDRSGGRNPYGFVSCPTCHDIHQPREARALRLEIGKNPRLCLACHEEKGTILATAHDPTVRGERGVCVACHDVHGKEKGPAPWRLRSGAKGTWNDRKCSPCHGQGKGSPIPHGSAPTHPVDVALPKGMKPQGLPLFDPLGGEFGRLLSCATCHDVHGVRGPGGRGAIERFLRKNPREGELCLACHESQGAVVSTPHDLRAQGKGSLLGPCGPCHTVHSGRSTRALWGLAPAPGEYLPNTLCRSCHRQGGSAQGEFLLLQYHMKDAEELRTARGTIYLQWPMPFLDEWALRTGEKPVLPLYDAAGTAGPQGTLQCVSCHDPHVWSPMGPFVKPGFGSLGPNVATDFLRLKDPKRVSRSACVICHKEGAVERYLKYHLVWDDVGEAFR